MKYLVCINNDGYQASLEIGKIYRVFFSKSKSAEGFIRIIDESGEDYLYPEAFFIPIKLQQKVEKSLFDSIWKVPTSSRKVRIRISRSHSEHGS